MDLEKQVGDIAPENNESLVSSPEIRTAGVQIDVEHLFYSVQVGSKKTDVKNILNDVSFRLRPGSMCALMGPSGSGKR
jgi:ABC-type multidrug transport system fused ATPase/permease subunit